MKTILIILAILAIGAGVVVYLTKKGKISDKDGDFIPDVVEDKVEEIKETVKEARKRAHDISSELKDVAKAVHGKPRKPRNSGGNK